MIPQARFENVTASLLKYMSVNYSYTAVNWPRTEFDSNNVQAWIRPDLLITEGPYYRQVGNGILGKDLILLLNINIFGRRDYIHSNSYALYRIRDEVMSLFREPSLIPVYDYVGGSIAQPIGAVRCFGVPTDEDLGEDTAAGVFQRNLSFDMRWEEQWEEPV